MPQNQAIALVDVGCLFKRTFEANPNKGAENTLAEILRIEERVAHLVLCLDHPPYRRRDIFPDYKAHRPEPETTEVYQKRLLYTQLKERGFAMARLQGEEADDVIATLARIYGETWPEVWLVGADKDLAQCVTENVLQLVPAHGERPECFRGPAQVKEKYGVTPAQMPLWLALVGDKSDNIPGVKGIGQVKAAGLIGDFKTLTGIAENLKGISGQVGKALAEGWEQLVLSLKLTTLDTRLPLDHQALLERRKSETPIEHPQGELELMGNATPMPEQHPDHRVAIAEALHQQAAKPEPLIGKDPRADEFMRQEAAARERNADRAAREQQDKHEAEEQREQDWRADKRREMAAAADAVISPPPQPAPAPRPTVVAMPGPVKANLRGLALLRAPFPAHQVSKLPKGTKAQNDCPPNEKRNCNVCGGWHHPKIIHLDYVGHAALTDRLLEADPAWSWEPMACEPNGLPLFDKTGGLWIRLTVCGVTRLGYGHAAGKSFQDPGAREKEIIGDALRNAAMRFGAALDLWHKGDELHDSDWVADEAWAALGGT